MTKLAPAVITCGLMLVSCTRTVQETSVRVPALSKQPAPPRTAVAENIRRQVRNAVDAGEGDLRIRALRQRLATNPEDVKSRLELARLYTRSGFPEVALEHYRLAAARFPDSDEVAVALARALSANGVAAEGRAHLQNFVATHPNAGWQAVSWLGILQDEAGECAVAERHHRAALLAHAGSDALHNNLGYNLLLQNRSQEAAAEFRKALELAPGSAVARNNLGMALAGQPSEAVGQWQSVTDRATAHNNLAAVLIERGDYQGARRELEVALGYRKDHPAALNNLALIADVEGGLIGGPGVPGRSAMQRFLRSVVVVLFGEPLEPTRSGAETQAAPQTNKKPAVRTAGEE